MTRYPMTEKLSPKQRERALASEPGERRGRRGPASEPVGESEGRSPSARSDVDSAKVHSALPIAQSNAHIATDAGTRIQGEVDASTRALEERRGRADSGCHQAPVRLAGRQQSRADGRHRHGRPLRARVRLAHALRRRAVHRWVRGRAEQADRLPERQSPACPEARRRRGLSPCARPQRHRRGAHRHARLLARQDHGGRTRRRQARLRRKADFELHSRAST